MTAVQAYETDTAAEHPSRRRRGGLIALIVILALVVAAAVFWMWYTTTPQYAITRLAQNAQAGNWEGVQRYMDTDAIANDIVDAALEQALADREGQLGQLGLLGEQLAEGIIESMRPRLVDEVREQMREQVQAQDGDARGWLGSIVVGGNPERLQRDGNEARAVVQVPYRGRQVDLDLGMIRQDDQWRVVQLNNAPELVEEFRPQ